MILIHMAITMVMKGGMTLYTILKNCRLIPELSGQFDREFANVVLAEGKIAGVHPADQTDRLPKTVETIDCRGMTLLPGLFDLHTHLNWDYHNGVIRLNDFKLLLNSCHSARRFLELGITTIRDMGSPKRVSLSVRDAVRSGLFPGPRILSGGIILRPTASDQPADPYNFLRYVSGAEEYARAAKEEIGCGADYVKLYAPGDPPELLPEELAAAVRIAHMRGRGVAVHAHDAGAVSMCLNAGVDTIEHGSFIREEDIRRLKESKSYLVPTLAVLSDRVPTPGFTPERKRQMLSPLLRGNEKNITAAYQSGLILGFGTDVPVEDQILNPGLEFYMRKEHCGMSNIDMLLQATKYSAKIVGLEQVTGEIREGMCADLLLVDGKPDQDISAMYQKPELVFAGGQLYHPQRENGLSHSV